MTVNSANAATEPSGRIRTLTYVTVEKASLYTAVMRVFVQAQERFQFRLRLQEVLDELEPPAGTCEPREVEAALAQLCEWGNLETSADASDVRHVEDFYKPRHVYQMSPLGEAVEQGLARLQATSKRFGELRAAALSDIAELLRVLKDLSADSKPEPGITCRTLLALWTCFEDFADDAHAFMSSLQRKIDSQAARSKTASDNRKFIADVERFIGNLMIAADHIAQTLRDIGQNGSQRLFHAAAERGIADGVETPGMEIQDPVDQWRRNWQRLNAWFISRPGCPSNAENLRRMARACIPAMLEFTAAIDDRRFQRIDRSNDFRALARWFLEAPSDGDAHRLWRSVFGLCPARHLITNDATMDRHETDDVDPGTSWLDAPPLHISPRLRASGARARSASLSRIIDRTAEKKKLADATLEEALSILSAHSRFATGRRMRLSEMDLLQTGEFDVLLDLLGEAVAARVFSADTAEILSNDGCLRVRLEPTGDGNIAVIETPEGAFSGPDHWIIVERISGHEVLT
jgi:uncharacterized protein (TIGR02677 family)